jgi:hypothetical protein
MAKLLGDSINYILRRIIGQKNKVLAEIIINWPRIVGAELSGIASPMKIYSIREKGEQVNVLMVQADSSAAGLKLSYQQELVIERIAIYFGHKAVHRLKIKTGV